MSNSFRRLDLTISSEFRDFFRRNVTLFSFISIRSTESPNTFAFKIVIGVRDPMTVNKNILVLATVLLMSAR